MGFTVNTSGVSGAAGATSVGAVTPNPKLVSAGGRPWDLDDTKALKAGFVAFKNYCGTRSVPGGSEFYTFLETGAFMDACPPPEVRDTARAMASESLDANGKRAYEQLLLNVFNRWVDNTTTNAKRVVAARPALARDIRGWSQTNDVDTLRDRLADPAYKSAALTYQDPSREPGEVKNPFVFFDSKRLSAYAHELPPTTRRIYLNPPKAVMPALASELMQSAERNGVPFQFKLMDFSLDSIKSDAHTRTDRMVFYTDGPTSERLVGLLGEIRQRHPAWFNGRTLPRTVKKVGEGIGVADDPSPEQHRRFGGSHKKTSASGVRSDMLQAASRELSRKALLTVPALRKCLDDGVARDRNLNSRDVAQAMAAGLDPEKAFPGPSQFAKRTSFRIALDHAMVDVMAKIEPHSLHNWMSACLGHFAPQYGVDPHDFSRNVPIAGATPAGYSGNSAFHP